MNCEYVRMKFTALNNAILMAELQSAVAHKQLAIVVSQTCN